MVEAHVPVRKVLGLSREYGCGWWQALAQAKSVRGPAVRGYVRATYVKHSTLNSAIEQPLCDWGVKDRANATSSA